MDARMARAEQGAEIRLTREPLAVVVAPLKMCGDLCRAAFSRV